MAGKKILSIDDNDFEIVRSALVRWYQGLRDLKYNLSEADEARWAEHFGGLDRMGSADSIERLLVRLEQQTEE